MQSLRVGLLAILVGGYACGGSSTEPAGTSGQPSASVIVQDFSFNAATLKVSLGTQVRWTNQGPSDHTATSDDAGLWDSGRISGNQAGGGGGGGGTYGGGAAGGSYSRTFVRVGEFAYHCSIHPQMKGTIIVAE